MTPSDAWTAGEAYEAYMGRWSRPLAEAFLGWLRPEPSARWLDVGCGTGALTEAIGALCKPGSIVACDPSEAFIAHARRRPADSRATFVIAGSEDLPSREGGFDVVASGLALNFMPDPGGAVASMRLRLRPGGLAAVYVWDYAGEMQFLRVFWDEAVALDPAAAEMDEGRRFPICQPEPLSAIFRAAGLREVRAEPIEIGTEFTDFADYWRPFLAGTGPAPAYVATLDPERREALRARLERRLRAEAGSPIRLRARAWGVRGERRIA